MGFQLKIGRMLNPFVSNHMLHLSLAILWITNVPWTRCSLGSMSKQVKDFPKGDSSKDGPLPYFSRGMPQPQSLGTQRDGTRSCSLQRCWTADVRNLAHASENWTTGKTLRGKLVASAVAPPPPMRPPKQRNSSLIFAHMGMSETVKRRVSS